MAGRPRDPACDRAILDAALREYGEHGFYGMSVDAVAARAGVGKATIYRRFPSKAELVVRAAVAIADEVAPAVDTGSFRGDVDALLHSLRGVLADPVVGAAIRRLVVDATRDAELARLHEELVRTRRARTFDVFARAVQRGEMRADVDQDLAADHVVSPIFYRALVRRAPVDDAYIDAVRDAFLSAYSTQVAAETVA